MQLARAFRLSAPKKKQRRHGSVLMIYAITGLLFRGYFFRKLLITVSSLFVIHPSRVLSLLHYFQCLHLLSVK